MNTQQKWLTDRLKEEGLQQPLDSINLEKAFLQEKALEAALSKMGSQSVPGHSMQQALMKAKWQQRLKRWLPTTFAYGAGVSTAFAVMMIFNLNFLSAPAGVDSDQVVAIKQVVHYTSPDLNQNVLNTIVALDSKQDVPWAMVTIHLPDGVELEGFPGLSTVAYDTALFKGENQLPLTLIRTQGMQEGELEVAIDTEQSPQVFKVPIQVANRTDVF